VQITASDSCAQARAERGAVPATLRNSALPRSRQSARSKTAGRERKHRLALVLECDQRAPQGLTGDEARGAVDWIEHARYPLVPVSPVGHADRTRAPGQAGAWRFSTSRFLNEALCRLRRQGGIRNVAGTAPPFARACAQLSDAVICTTHPMLHFKEAERELYWRVEKLLPGCRVTAAIATPTRLSLSDSSSRDRNRSSSAGTCPDHSDHRRRRRHRHRLER